MHEGADGGGVAAELVVAALLGEEHPVGDLCGENVGVHAACLGELLERVGLHVLLLRQHGERAVGADEHGRTARSSNPARLFEPVCYVRPLDPDLLLVHPHPIDAFGLLC